MWGVGISIKLFDGFGRARRESRVGLVCRRECGPIGCVSRARFACAAPGISPVFDP